MARQEKEDKNHKQLLEKIKKLCDELSPWEVFQIYLYIKSVAVQDKVREIVLNWLVFQLDLDNKIKARHKKKPKSVKR
jgi:hypothetical protein